MKNNNTTTLKLIIINFLVTAACLSSSTILQKGEDSDIELTRQTYRMMTITAIAEQLDSWKESQTRESESSSTQTQISTMENEQPTLSPQFTPSIEFSPSPPFTFSPRTIEPTKLIKTSTLQAANYTPTQMVVIASTKTPIINPNTTTNPTKPPMPSATTWKNFPHIDAFKSELNKQNYQCDTTISSIMFCYKENNQNDSNDWYEVDFYLNSANKINKITAFVNPAEKAQNLFLLLTNMYSPEASQWLVENFSKVTNDEKIKIEKIIRDYHYSLWGDADNFRNLEIMQIE